MAIEGQFLNEGINTLDYTADAARVAGEIIRLADGRAGVVKTALASGDKGAVYTKGVVRVLCTDTTEFAAGAPVVWDISASLGIAGMGALGDVFVGTAIAASGSSQAYVDVDLNNAASLELFTETILETGALTPYGTSVLDSAAGAITGSLAAGPYIGAKKTIVMHDATASSTVSITNHVTSDPEVATFDAVDEMLLLIWTGTEWETVKATATFV